MGFRRKIAFWSVAILPHLAVTGAPQDWEKTVTLLPRGDFPNPRPLVATYSFGWNGLVAATAEGPLRIILALVGVTLGTINVVGGFVVTDRMLQMFTRRVSTRSTTKSGGAKTDEAAA